MRLLDEDESINPALSVVNLVDVFLVLVAALLIAIAQNPLNPFLEQDVTVIKNAGKPNMEMIINILYFLPIFYRDLNTTIR